MNPVLVWVIAAAVTVFHIWASRRKPKYWYLGAIVPGLWMGLVVFLLVAGQLNLGEDWKHVVFPSAILLLLWLDDHQAAKKKEMEQMKSRDL